MVKNGNEICTNSRGRNGGYKFFNKKNAKKNKMNNF